MSKRPRGSYEQWEDIFPEDDTYKDITADSDDGAIEILVERNRTAYRGEWCEYMRECGEGSIF